MCPGHHSHTPRQLVQGSLREFLERLSLWCNATTAAEVTQQNIREPFFFLLLFLLGITTQKCALKMEKVRLTVTKSSL